MLRLLSALGFVLWTTGLAAQPAGTTRGKTTLVPSLPTETTLARRNARTQVTDYENDVSPLIGRLGCANLDCHGAPVGKGGMKLSMFGADPQADCDALSRAAGGRRVNRMMPERSLLLLKLSGDLPHGGGKLAPVDSEAYQTLLTWIARGTEDRDPAKPLLRGVSTGLRDKLLASGEALDLKVTATFSDGTSRDVTALASFRSSLPGVAKVSPAGQVTAGEPGQSVLVATYRRLSGVTLILVPHKLAEPFPEMATENPLDQAVLAKLRLLGLPPSPRCTDAEFVRRVYLDVIGLLPTPDEVRAFAADSAADKRAKLIDRLLARDEFADFWALKWGDLLRIKSEYPVKIWPKGVQTYYRWVRDSLVANKPYDQFARELLVSSGSNFRSGPANFYRGVNSKDPLSHAEIAALLFMGARVSCARCHGHPDEPWTVDDDARLAAFFAQVKFKGTGEWKEEVVYLDPDATFKHPITKQVVTPTVLGGEAPALEPGADARLVFANWLTAPNNPWFARNLANRVWFWLLGRGIVEEPDDMRPTNPPSNSALLDYLAGELTSHNYDLRHLFRVILNSETYQRSSTPTAQNKGDQGFFAHYPARRMGAEQLIDAICQITETNESFSSVIPEPYTYLPSTTRAAQVADGSIITPFLELFGRPPRDTPYESDRCSRASMRQVTHLLNSTSVDNRVLNSPRLKRLLAGGQPDDTVIDEFYLASLSRLPNDTERAAIRAHLASHAGDRATAFQDFLWALMNTKEFVLIH
ncbi:MAG: DUF1553 domain-containing protein [Armatimonadetes bacterium]|nr:DUF1553 domain-containing protein [Armatimonadota bacterium]